MHIRHLIPFVVCSVSLLIAPIQTLHGQQLKMLPHMLAERSIILSAEDVALLKNPLVRNAPKKMVLQLFESCPGLSEKMATIVLPGESRTLDEDSFGIHVKSVSATARNVTFSAGLERTAMVQGHHQQNTLLLTGDASDSCSITAPYPEGLPEPEYLDLREPYEHKFRSLAWHGDDDADINYKSIITLDFDFIMAVDDRGNISIIVIEVDSSGHYRRRVINTGINQFSHKGEKLLREALESSNVLLLERNQFVVIFWIEREKLGYELIEQEKLDEDVLELEMQARQKQFSSESVLLVDFHKVTPLPKDLIYELPRGKPGKPQSKADQKVRPLVNQSELSERDFSLSISKGELDELLSGAHFDEVDIQHNWRKHVYELESSEQYERAAEYMEKILSFYPNNRYVMEALIWHLIKRDLVSRALSRVGRWRARHPGEDDTFLNEMLTPDYIAKVKVTSYKRFYRH